MRLPLAWPDAVRPNVQEHHDFLATDTSLFAGPGLMPKADAKPMAAAGMGRRLGYVGLAAVILAVLAGGSTHLLDRWVEFRSEQTRRIADAAVSEMAVALQQELANQLDGFQALGRGPGLPELLESGDPDRLRAREQAVAAGSTLILGVRLLPVGQTKVDYDAIPPLTYATLEMLATSEQKGEAPRPEVQLMGTKGRHVALLSRIEDDQGRLSGHLLVGLDVGLLQSALDKAPFAGGYAELRQPVAGMSPVTVAKRGARDNAAVAGETIAETRPLAGSPWVVRYEAPAATSGALMNADLIVWGTAAGLLLLVAGLVLRSSPRPKAAAASAAGSAHRPATVPAVDTAPAPSKTTAGQAEPAAAPAEPSTEPGAEEKAEEPIAAVDGSIFRMYDIRGIVGDTVTPQVARSIGRAIGTEADVRNQAAVCVARDGRPSSRELADALMEGLSEAGREVVDIGQVPTPVLYYATHYLEAGSGVMVTGSHNPPEYNGFKIVLGGRSLFGEEIAAIRSRLESGQLSTGMGVHRTMDLGSEYIRQVSEDIPVALGNPYKVVIDCGNGAAGELAPRLYRALGHDVVELHCDIDGSFPNHHPDPSQPENLRDLIQSVEKEQADLGLAFDGDGDRLVVVDGAGNIIWPDRLMMLFAQDVLAANAGARIVYDVKCTRELGRLVSKLGGEPVLSRSGHSVIKNKMNETGAVLGGELAGHICFADRWYGFDDALYAGARLLEILRQAGVSAADAFQRLPGGLSTPEIRVAMQEGEPAQFMQSFTQSASFEGAEVITVDGLRAEYPDGWGLVRASNTTPSLVLRFEADDEGALQRIQATFKTALLGVDGDLSLPF
ncbi:MAG: phosphomannomutase/phosphoglucomutase [Gammaproteobacteria bacterium]|nr:phosphomannomutase/phosphoglucomutase [Gammaproteobacteria bacterium]